MHIFGDILYRKYDVLWRTAKNNRGNEFISHSPLCPNNACHSVLQEKTEGYFCANCQKIYPQKKDFSTILREVQDSWEGFQTLKQPVYSLDLPPTKVVDENEDENYWVQARISEKEGKRMAVVYFGERVEAQEKQNYSQIFLDFEDEQLRFDKNNKNPMKLLAKLTAEFGESTTILKVNKENHKKK
jgi:hypothetical protein